MTNEFYKKIENFKNNDNILSDDINKKTGILNNTSRVYNNLLNRYKDEYKKSMIIRILMIWQMIIFLI